MRAAIFIDGGYLLKQLQDAKVNPDYSRLAEFLLKPLRRNTQLDLMRCYFYYCPPWMSEKPTEAELRRMAAHERFMAEIQEGCDRWQVRLGKLERRREGDKEVFAQKRVDVQLSVDLVQHTAAGHIQHAVLVAGDSDFIPAIVAAKESGTTLTLWCDRDRSVHRDLLKLADEVHYIRWKDFPSKPHAELRGETRGEQRPRPELRLEQAQRVELRLEQVVQPAVEAPLAGEVDGKVESKVEQKGAPVARGGRRPQLAQPELFASELGAEPVAETVEPAKKKRGRRRGSGKGAKGAEVGSTGEGVEAGPVTHTIPEPTAKKAPARQPRQPRQPRVDAPRVVEKEQDAGEPGDDIGNIKPEDDASGAGNKTGRRRRGGRGRRRKSVGAPGPAS